MSSFSNYLEEKVLQHFFGGVTQTSPTDLYVALYVSDPTESDTGTEVNGTNYARQKIAFGSITTSGTKSAATNKSIITFPQAGGSWGTITHFAIRDAESGGNMLAYGPLSISKEINTGDRMEFPIGGIAVTLD